MTESEYEKYIDDTISEVQSRFGESLRTFDRLTRGAITAADDGAFLSASVSQQASRDLLEQSGFNDVILDFVNNSFRLAVDNTAAFVGAAIGADLIFSDESLAIMNSAKESTMLSLSQIGDDLSTRVSIGFSRYSRGELTREAFISELADSISLYEERYIKTEVDTAFSAFNRLANQRLAMDAGIKLFRYSGPNDAKTRDFCRNALSGVYGKTAKTLDDWDKLNNVPERKGQPSPVSTFLGGYNCRHNLIPVRSEDIG